MAGFSLEERQRAEKRNREDKGHQFTPRWFNMRGEISPTPWGDLEVYEYNGKYTEHRSTIDGLDSTEEVDIKSIEFNPWQYGNLSAEWGMRRLCSYHISPFSWKALRAVVSLLSVLQPQFQCVNLIISGLARVLCRLYQCGILLIDYILRMISYHYISRSCFSSNVPSKLPCLSPFEGLIIVSGFKRCIVSCLYLINLCPCIIS